jgi:threonine/homoserine/homoserine lactone efflux protein
MLAAFLTFAAASALLAMVPGPDTLVMLRSIVLEGLTRWQRSPRFQRRLNGVTGVVLIGFGARLAVEG